MSKTFFNFREEHGAGEDGTPELVNKYKADTPGQGGSTEPKQKARKGDMLQNKDEPEKSLKAEAVELDEKAPKMKGDWLKKEREKNRAHDAAMGRTATGRKKPTRPMTSTQRSLASLRKEEVEITEGMDKEKFHSAEAELVKYAKTSGGIDKRDFMDVAKMLGQLARVSILDSGPILSKLNKKLQGMDTDPRDKVYSILKQKKLMEAVELDEAMKYTDKQIKMAYGIINDPRYKGGNMTAIVRKIEQIAKGLSKHPGVEKAIQRTNESTELSSIDALIESLIESEIDMIEENYEESSMMLNQLEAMEHFIDGIYDYVEECEDCPEWYQNKLTMAFSQLQSLYSYAAGEMGDDDDEEDDMEEQYESTQAYGDSLRQKERERQMKSMKPGEMDKLRKLRQMLDKEKKNK